MRVLSIGNSFSQDAHRYLYKIARADKVTMKTINLYRGGCPLSRHYRNILSDSKDYLIEVNGEYSDVPVSIKDVILSQEWEVITIQQVSYESPNYETYQPYLDKVVEYIRLCAPKAKVVIHQTWAYEENSEKLNGFMGYKTHSDMFRDVEAAYKKAAEAVGADFVIPSGELFEMMLASGIKKIHRDTFHASLGLGRYALGLLWYAVITGNDAMDNTFSDFDEEIPAEEIAIAKNCVKELCKKYGF